jgi:nicotinate dehydrogenase subunit B
MTWRNASMSLNAHPLASQWIAFEASGLITVRTGKVEIGQGVALALVRIAAEELDVDPAQIRLVTADTRSTPNEGFTAGSASIVVSGGAIRRAAAAVRAILTGACAEKAGVPLDTIEIRRGRFAADGRDTGETYWTLAGAVDLDQPVLEIGAPKQPSEHRLLGQPGERTDLAAKVAGAPYLHDLSLPGMLHGRMVRPPFPGWRPDPGSLPAWTDSEVRLVQDGGFLGVVAPDEAQAVKLAEEAQARIAWTGDSPSVDDPLEALERCNAPAETTFERAGPPRPVRQQLAATFSRRPLAHASIGASCAVAQYTDDVLKVWTHSQGVFMLAGALAMLTGLPEDRIHVVHVPAAGCYGHNGADDAAADAALLALAVPGRPVRLLWSRAEELGWSPCGAPMRTQVTAGLGEDGRLTHMNLDILTASHVRRPGFGAANLLAGYLKADPIMDPVNDVPLAYGGGGDRNAVPLYAIDAVRVTKRLARDFPLRTSALRSLGAHVNVVAIEAVMDDAAAAAGCDSARFRLDHLDDPRARAVIERARDMSGWDAPGDRTLGLGFARYENTGAYCAAVAEVVLGETVRVKHLWLAVDAGLVIDPDGVANQVEGGAVQSISWTLKEEIRFEGGAPALPDWDAYPILTFDEVPEISVEIVKPPGVEEPLGVGEASPGPVAAAVANAVARGLGVRIGDLPITRDRIISALA